MKGLVILLLMVSLLAPAQVSQTAKTLYMRDEDVARVTIQLGSSTILSFPSRPSKVVLGNKNHFAIEYIENDIAISALQPNARCNLFAYLEGRRFSFNLITSTYTGDEILLIRDAYLKNKWKSNRK